MGVLATSTAVKVPLEGEAAAFGILYMSKPFAPFLVHSRPPQMHPRQCFHACSLAVGSKLLVKDFTRKKRKGGKLDMRWKDPYTIVQILGKGLYTLEAADLSRKIIDRVHGTHLKAYFTPLHASKNVSL